MKVHDLLATLPELVLLLSTLLILMVGVFSTEHMEKRVYGLTQLTLLVVLALIAWLWMPVSTVAFSGMLVIDGLSQTLKWLMVLVMMCMTYYGRGYLNSCRLPVLEYTVLSLLALLGMMLVVSSYHLLVLYVSLELMSLPVYAMVALRHRHAPCVEAGLKYFVVGSLASALLLYGFSFLYGVTGSLDLHVIAQSVANLYAVHQTLLQLAVVFIVAGLCFKLGLVPFHMWVPDVYEGAPTIVTLFITTVPKIAVFGIIMRLLVQGLASIAVEWQLLLVLVSVLSIFLGNVVAVVQTNMKRMLAYSSIAHMGYLLLGIVTLHALGYAAALLYLGIYVLTSLVAFGVLMMLQSEDHEVVHIHQLQGLNRRYPGLAVLMLLAMFSFAGVPPIAGFMAKFGLLGVLIESHMVWLAVFAMVLAIVGAFYYIRVIKVMYFEASPIVSLTATRGQRGILMLNGLLVLFFGLFPGVLMTISQTVMK